MVEFTEVFPEVCVSVPQLIQPDSSVSSYLNRDPSQDVTRVRDKGTALNQYPSCESATIPFIKS